MEYSKYSTIVYANLKVDIINIYHIGIIYESVDKISKSIEMQNNVTKRVVVREEVLVGNLIEL